MYIIILYVMQHNILMHFSFLFEFFDFIKVFLKIFSFQIFSIFFAVFNCLLFIF